MANMGYCRFRNTLNDLRDCHEHMDDPEEGKTNPNNYDEDVVPDTLSKEEIEARNDMIILCRKIAERYEEED